MPSANKINAAARFLFFIIPALLASATLSGCASPTWEPVVQAPPQLLSWPPAPCSKVSYIGEISQFTPTNESWTTIFTGKSKAGKLLKPVAVSISPSGKIAIADQDRQGVHLYNPESKNYTFLFMAGKLKIETPVGVAFNDTEILYVTDAKLQKIILYDAAGKFIKTIDSGLDGLPLLRPTGITYNRYDKLLYVADTPRHQILMYDRVGQVVGSLGQRGEEIGSFNFPTFLDSDTSGRVYINDALNFRLQIFHPEHKNYSAFGGHGNGSGDFASPKGIAVDSSGYVYVAETLFDTIQIFNDIGSYMLNFGAKGRGPAEFWMPSGLFIDQNDTLYACDTYNGRILIFQLLTGVASGSTESTLLEKSNVF